MTTYYALKVENDIKMVIPWKDKEEKPTVEDFVQLMRRQHYELQYINQAGYETKEGGKSGPEIPVPIEIDEVVVKADHTGEYDKTKEVRVSIQPHPAFV